MEGFYKVTKSINYKYIKKINMYLITGYEIDSLN